MLDRVVRELRHDGPLGTREGQDGVVLAADVEEALGRVGAQVGGKPAHLVGMAWLGALAISIATARLFEPAPYSVGEADDEGAGW
jgi:hypothetical protein